MSIRFIVTLLAIVGVLVMAPCSYAGAGVYNDYVESYQGSGNENDYVASDASELEASKTWFDYLTTGWIGAFFYLIGIPALFYSPFLFFVWLSDRKFNRRQKQEELKH